MSSGLGQSRHWHDVTGVGQHSSSGFVTYFTRANESSGQVLFAVTSQLVVLTSHDDGTIESSERTKQMIIRVC